MKATTGWRTPRPNIATDVTRRFADGERVREFQAIERQAYRRLEILDAAPPLLARRALPSNRFEALGGERIRHGDARTIRVDQTKRLPLKVVLTALGFETQHGSEVNAMREAHQARTRWLLFKLPLLRPRLTRWLLFRLHLLRSRLTRWDRLLPLGKMTAPCPTPT